MDSINKTKYNSKKFNLEKINFIIYFLFSVIALAIFFTSIMFKQTELNLRLFTSFVSAIFFSLYVNFYLTYTSDTLKIRENNFPRYGIFFSFNYWKKYDKTYFNFLIIGTIILFFIIFLFSSFIILNRDSLDYNFYVIPFSFIFSIFTNLILFFILIKRQINFLESYLIEILSLNVITHEEYRNYSIQLQKDPELIHSYTFKENIFRKALKKRVMLIKPLGNHLYYEMFYIFSNTSPDYEEASDRTYDLLFTLINSEKFDSAIFLKDFYELREKLFSSGQLDPLNWTMTEVLEIYLKKGQEI